MPETSAHLLALSATGLRQLPILRPRRVRRPSPPPRPISSRSGAADRTAHPERSRSKTRCTAAPARPAPTRSTCLSWTSKRLDGPWLRGWPRSGWLLVALARRPACLATAPWRRRLPLPRRADPLDSSTRAITLACRGQAHASPALPSLEQGFDDEGVGMSVTTQKGALRPRRGAPAAAVARQVKEQRRGYARAVLRALARSQQGQPTAQVQRTLRGLADTTGRASVPHDPARARCGHHGRALRRTALSLGHATIGNVVLRDLLGRGRSRSLLSPHRRMRPCL